VNTKTAFEVSGNSPTVHATVKISENGALIQTGRGVEETKRRITEAFEKIRQHLPAPSLPPQEPKVETIYTEHQERRFQVRCESLIEAALISSHIGKARSDVF
jgi:hypothetical protein